MKVLVILQWVVCHGNGSWKKNHCWALHDSVSLRTVEGWHIQGERKKKSSELSMFYSLIHHMHCMNCNHIWWNAVTKACLGKWSSHGGLSASQNRYQHAWGESLLQAYISGHQTGKAGYGHRLQVLFPSLPPVFPSFNWPLQVTPTLYSKPSSNSIYLFSLCSNIERNQVLKPHKLLVALWSLQTGMPNYITYDSGRDQKTAQKICLLSLLKLSRDHNKTGSHTRTWERFPYFQLLAGLYKKRVQVLLWL